MEGCEAGGYNPTVLDVEDMQPLKSLTVNEYVPGAFTVANILLPPGGEDHE